MLRRLAFLVLLPALAAGPAQAGENGVPDAPDPDAQCREEWGDLVQLHSENGNPGGPVPDALVDPLDSTALEQLGDDVEDAAYPATFAARYQELLPKRLDRISAALGVDDEADLDAALDASLSLKVSSTTVGARELEQLATVIELSVRRRDVATARSLADALANAGRRADRALATYLAERHAG